MDVGLGVGVTWGMGVRSAPLYRSLGELWVRGVRPARSIQARLVEKGVLRNASSALEAELAARDRMHRCHEHADLV